MLIRLLDGQLPQRRPDRQWEARLGLDRHRYYFADEGNPADGDKGGGGGDEGNKKDPPPKDDPVKPDSVIDTPDEKILDALKKLGVDGEKVDLHRLKDIIDDRNKKGRKLSTAQKELDEALAKLKEIDDKDKSDLDKEREKREEAEKKLLDALSSAASTNRVNTALSQGIVSKFAKHAASDLSDAIEANENLDPEKWWEDYKTNNPELYGTAKPLPTGGGGPGPGGGAPSRDEKLKAVEEEIRVAKARGFMTVSEEAALLGKREAIRQGLVD